MLWALGQPAAAVGLIGAFLLGLGLRAFAQRACARWLGLADGRAALRPRPRKDVDPLGAVAVVLGGTGWGRRTSVRSSAPWSGSAPGSAPGSGSAPGASSAAGTGSAAAGTGSTAAGTGSARPVARRAAVLAAGPAAVFVASQLAFAAFCTAYPADRAALRLNRPSDVLRGVIAPSMAEQLMLSVAVGLLCFGILALVPIPPLDGFWLLRLALSPQPAPEVPPTVDRIGVIVLLVLLVVPVGPRPPLVTVLDIAGTPLLGLWA